MDGSNTAKRFDSLSLDTHLPAPGGTCPEQDAPSPESSTRRRSIVW